MDRPPRYMRARHLVILPVLFQSLNATRCHFRGCADLTAPSLFSCQVVGTGRGGMRHRTGDVCKALLPLLYAATQRYKFDVALVCW